jgi:AcrR family transcriptional regulator
MSARDVDAREARRARMLAAAGRLFERQGYARTTFDEIAAAAECGVATVYKYFGSKDAIVAALLTPDLERILACGEGVIASPPEDPADAVVALLGCYGTLGRGGWAPREILRLTVFPGLGNEGPLTEFVRAADAATRDQIGRLFRTLVDRGRVPPALPAGTASDVVFALLNQHFGAFLTDPAMTHAEAFRRLEAAVRVLFEDWRACSPARGARSQARGGRRQAAAHSRD